MHMTNIQNISVIIYSFEQSLPFQSHDFHDKFHLLGRDIVLAVVVDFLGIFGVKVFFQHLQG